MRLLTVFYTSFSLIKLFNIAARDWQYQKHKSYAARELLLYYTSRNDLDHSHKKSVDYNIWSNLNNNNNMTACAHEVYRLYYYCVSKRKCWPTYRYNNMLS